MPRLRAVRPKDSAEPKRGKRRELTHADVVAGNEQRQEQIKQIDQGGDSNPDQRGDRANIRQNTSNVNRRNMR